MPFKSQAQRAKFGAMVKEGKISQKTFDEWNAASPANLPERIGKKPVTAKKPVSPKHPVSGSDPRLMHIGLALHKKKNR